MSNPPTIGRIVHYMLTEIDVQRIEAQRQRTVSSGSNDVHVGEIYPAIVVRSFPAYADGERHRANLQVLLDGSDTYWATSAEEGPQDTPPAGCWFWPPRLDMTREGR